jgi:outer membrane protein OmpA-like peptidoglycan-associated protein
MIDHTTIRKDMDVVGSDGTALGKVDSVERERIKLTRRDSADHQHHYLPTDWVARVDGNTVHLNRDASALAGLAAAGTAGAAGTAHAADRDRHHPVGDGRKTNWLPWIIGGLALLALVAALSQCDKDDADDANVADTASEEVVVPRVAGAPLAAGTLAYDLDRFLASEDGTPRTFTFERLNFNTGQATIRDADDRDLDDIARVFAAYPKAKAAVVGYTDARGDASSNKELGADRARAVIAALASRGVDPDRFEARTGGESDPAATNAEAGGRFENRRTELILLKR